VIILTDKTIIKEAVSSVGQAIIAMSAQQRTNPEIIGPLAAAIFAVRVEQRRQVIEQGGVQDA